jgi:dTDP-4-amino-4,6-dideoxygalactose transaminase
MHPYYRESYGLMPDDFPVAARMWPRLVTLPLFVGMTREDIRLVRDGLRALLR